MGLEKGYKPEKSRSMIQQLGNVTRGIAKRPYLMVVLLVVVIITMLKSHSGSPADNVSC